MLLDGLEGSGMKRTFICLFVFLFVSVFSYTHAFAQEGNAMTGNFNIILGMKKMDSDWEPLDDHWLIGVNFDFGKESWPAHLAVDVSLTRSTGSDPVLGDVVGNTSEINFGFRKIWDMESVHPFLGAGIAIIHGKVEPEDSWDKCEVTSAGYWFGGGAYWRLRERYNVGFDIKRSSATADMDNVTCSGTRMMFKTGQELGGTQMGVVVGLHW
jgi:hypothetical protein